MAHGCRTAWDVLVFVGRRLFLDCHGSAQIRAELLARDVPLSESQIAKLGQKFILYLALAHRRATPRIKQAMALSGGYILHLDALHQDDAPALMSGIDGLSRLVLANVKLPSEKTERIAPFLRRIRSEYGEPIACVHDMGTGICKAVDMVFAGIRDFVCHFHFLRDVGKDLLEPSYRKLRSCFRKHAFTTGLSALARQARQRLVKTTDEAGACGQGPAGKCVEPAGIAYALSLWCLQAKRSGDGYGFPFDRPLLAVAERVWHLVDTLPGLLQVLPSVNSADRRLFFKFSRKVLDVAAESDFQEAVDELRWRCKLFDRLRRCMRIAEAGGRNGLNDDGGTASMNRIRDGVEKFRRRLDTDEKLKSDPLFKKMAEQIDKYADKLFADPIQVQSPAGPTTVYPQRTNNILEQFFRRL
ncbi:MAG: transposase, partial [Desulfobacterales bacterium]|nr:transposase [Desulfobacterales bacterium]